MPGSLIFKALLTSSLSLCLPLAAQEPFRIHTGVHLVSDDVTVLSKRTSVPVENLTATDFRVFDNDREQQISRFSMSVKDDRPLAVTLLVEVMGYDSDVNALLPDAAGKAFAKLRPGDRIGIVAWGIFNGDSCVTTARMAQPPTADAGQVKRTLQSLAESTPASRTACKNARKKSKAELDASSQQLEQTRFEAIRLAVDQLTGAGDSRRELIVIEQDLGFMTREGADRSRDFLLHSGAALNAILEPSFMIGMVNNLSRALDGPKCQSNVLQFLADETGGVVLRPSRKRTGEALEEMLFQIFAEYNVSWKLPAQDGEFHRIRVELKDHPDARVRSRSGYFAASNP